MPADSGKLAEKAQDLAQWILDQALDGIGPLPSASDLADDYKSKPYANDAERVQGLIRWAVAKNAGTGFVTGLGGALTLPVTIPGSLAASLAIQAPMVAAIAQIYGHDTKDAGVRTAILLCTIGTAMEDVAKQAGVTLGGKAAMEVLKKVPGKVLIDINKRVGFRLLTKFGERGVLNLAKLVPLVGGAVGGCYLVGQAADKAFRQTADTTGIDARIDTAVAALQARIDIRTRELEVRLTRRMVGVLLAGIAGTIATIVVILWLLG
ncbi:MAG: EcsC family protein [Acidobacteria bacterium]|nr:EcsC family protein [Acidobacteriota bacterium]